MKNIAIMNSKGQITIPISIRESMNLRKGDKFFIIIKQENIILEKIPLANKKMRKELNRSFNYPEDF